jgi:hypothetical protein
MRSGKGLLALILILCSRFAKVTCADLVGTFTYPVENGLIFYNGETIDVSWTSTLSNASLYLFCRYEIDSVWNTKPSMKTCSTRHQILEKYSILRRELEMLTALSSF